MTASKSRRLPSTRTAAWSATSAPASLEPLSCGAGVALLCACVAALAITGIAFLVFVLATHVIVAIASFAVGCKWKDIRRTTKRAMKARTTQPPYRGH